MKKRKPNKKKLISLIMLGLLAGHNHALAVETTYINAYGKNIAEITVLSGDEMRNSFLYDPYYESYPNINLNNKLKDAIEPSVSYWTDMLGAGFQNSHPWQIAVAAMDNYANASATNFNFDSNGNYVPGNYVKDFLQGNRVLSRIDDFTDGSLSTDGEESGLSLILIGSHLGADRDGAFEGYWIDTDTLLPTNEQASDYVATIRHELGHSLGISKDAVSTSIPGLDRENITKLIYSPNSWNAHLIDQNGNPLDKDKDVITSSEFQTLKAKDANIQEEDFFIVDKKVTSSSQPGVTPGMVFFIGDHVTETLDGATFNGVSGLPVNAWEDYVYYNFFEGSHLQTPGMMSHRSYSNYTAFMEVELAVMQDLGYQLDRRAYFGRSVYGNNGTLVNTQGYSARNADGTAYLPGVYSNVPLGIGLHIYGSHNNITQKGDILTAGTGAVGVRMDGVSNILTIDKDTEIHADGKRGMGLLVSYGRNHVVNQLGAVTALGEGGKAAVFDFGSSSNGAVDEYRGSYIRFARSVNDSGYIYSSKNLSLTYEGINDIFSDYILYNSEPDELNGPLVQSFNVHGTLASSDDAIYIGKNAFVKEINIGEGAKLQGDITSEWKHFKTDGAYDGNQPLKIQYNGKKYDYDDYIPDLVTELNINTDLNYDGDINGRDNMELNVNNGTLEYSGEANVVKATIAKGATLSGGTYKLNDMTSEEYADEAAETGTMYNHGTLSAASDSINITGNLKSNGYLTGAVGTNTITVDGKADVDGSIATLANALPGESAAVLQTTGGVTGTLANDSPDNADKTTALLNYYGSIDDANSTISAHAIAADNLGEKTPEVAQGYTAVQNLYANLTNDGRKNELRDVYSMDVETAQSALTNIATDELRNNMATLIQDNDHTGRLVTNRLHNMWKQEDNTIVTEPELPGSNIWVNIGKSWGDFRDGANYNTSSITIGHDWQSGEQSRSGIFAGYRTASLAASKSHGDLDDVLVGYYSGSRNDDGLETNFYAALGYQRGRTKHNLFYNCTAGAKENSQLLELGGRLGYDIHANDGKLWHVTPYMTAQTSLLWLNGYNETGAGIYNKHVESDLSKYFGLQAGITLERPLRNGTYSLDFGLRQNLSGDTLTRSFHYEGDSAHTYTFSNNRDKTHAVISLTADTEFAPNWYITGHTTFQKGAHDKNLSASIELKHTW